jgi:hypothetical protein
MIEVHVKCKGKKVDTTVRYYSIKQKLPLVHYDATAAMLVSVIGILDTRITTDNKLSGYP